MKFENYLSQSWTDHANDVEKVANNFPTGITLAESNEQLAQLIGLVTHVMGEHLARWQEGVLCLQKIESHPSFIAGSETEKALKRSTAVLEIGDGKNPSLASFSPSDQIRIFAVTASAIKDHQLQRAQEFFHKALDLAQSKLEKQDPANRALAVMGHVLACTLEEKSPRSQVEIDWMILAAQTGRKYWEHAGGWLEVSRAEYRLANTYLQAKDLNQALEHAQICLEICHANKAGELDIFYGYEALAKVEKERGNESGLQTALGHAIHYFEKLGTDFKPDPKELRFLTELFSLKK